MKPENSSSTELPRSDNYRGQGADSHPSPEAIWDYYTERLSPVENETIQEHFTQCEDCADLVLELHEAVPGASVPGRHESELLEIDIARAWHRVRVKLNPPRSLARSRYMAMVAAAILVAIAVSWWFQEWNREVEWTRLAPLATARNAGRAEPCTQVFGHAKGWRFLLPVDGARSFATYRVEIRTEDRQLWAIYEPSSSEEGFTVAVPPAELLPGRYRLLVVGSGTGEVFLIEQFCVEVVD